MRAVWEKGEFPLTMQICLFDFPFSQIPRNESSPYLRRIRSAKPDGSRKPFQTLLSLRRRTDEQTVDKAALQYSSHPEMLAIPEMVPAAMPEKCAKKLTYGNKLNASIRSVGARRLQNCPALCPFQALQFTNKSAHSAPNSPEVQQSEFLRQLSELTHDPS